MLPTKFQFIWLSSFKGEDFLKINQSETRNACRNLVGIIYGMFSMKIAHFVQMGWQTWPPHAFLVSDWLIFKKSSPLKLLSHMN
jgi:hypothetical protein